MKLAKAVACLAISLASFGAFSQGFEGGIPAGWTCKGYCSTSGSNGDVTLAPTGASAYGFVSTAGSSETGVSPFGLGGETTGSVLRSSTFSADAGDPLKFFFNYITSDGAGFADYAFARLLNASDLSQAALLFTARTTPSGSIVPGFGMPAPEATLNPTDVLIIGGAPTWSALGSDSGRCFDLGCGYTGWIESNYNIGLTGDFILEFGVVNWSDSNFASGMAFDGITVNGNPIAVPEPSVYVMMIAGLLVIGSARRRKGVAGPV